MSILRAALLASSSSISPSCRPAAAPHLCRTAASHRPVWLIPNNAAPLGHHHHQQQQFRICLLSNHSGGSNCWRPSAFWARVVSPLVSLIGSPDSPGEGPCSCRADLGKWPGGDNSATSLSSLLNITDHHQQRPYATAARNPNSQSASSGAAAASCFSAGGGRRMRGRESESGSGRASSGSGARRAFAEDDRQGSGVGAPLTDWEKAKFEEVKIKPTKKLLTLPTVLTLARVAAVPAILAVFYSNEPWATSAGAVIFVLAALTDWLDGYLARKMKTSSAFGAFLDPVADKLMVAAALVLLCTKPLANADLAAIPWLLPLPTIAIIGREITMSAVREWAAAQGGDLHKAVAVNSLGKIKTASQMISITLLLVSVEGGLDSRIAGIAGVGLLYVAAGLALWSLAMYMRGIWGSMFK